MRNKDLKLKAEWDAFMEQQDKIQAQEIAEARANGKAWHSVDGGLQKAWKGSQANDSFGA